MAVTTSLSESAVAASSTAVPGAASVTAKVVHPPIYIPTSKPNLYLRTARPGAAGETSKDAKFISKLFSHPGNMKYIHESPNPNPPAPEVYEGRIPDWLEATSKDESCFMVICLRAERGEGINGTGNDSRELSHGAEVGIGGGEEDDGEVMGFGGINALGFKSIDGGEKNVRFANVGVLIHEPYHHRGYAKAALEATIEASFELWGVDIVVVDTAPRNVPFRSLMGKFGLGEGKKTEEVIAWEFGKAEWVNRGEVKNPL